MNYVGPIFVDVEPRRLRSLWEIMLKTAALDLGRVLSDIGRLEFACVQMRIGQPHLIHDASGNMQRVAADIVNNARRACILADLDEVLPEIDRFAAMVSRDAPLIEDVKAAANHLRNRLLDELKSEFYLQVVRADVPFYGKKELFGPKVTAKFKSASADVENAGNCVALRQPDACVFHLMRAMEVAVRTLSARLKVTITPQTTWRQMTGLMDDKIKKMPETTHRLKRKKNDWEAARANLHHVGSVWRNNTMHPATAYSHSQARDVFNAVRVFMGALAEL